MNLPSIIFGVLCFLDVFRSSSAWDNDELEVFDVVEEVNQNFYDVLGVTQVCSLQICLKFERPHSHDVDAVARNDEFD